MTTKTEKDKLNCVKRELALRQTAYPRWVKEGRISKERAAHELECMEQIVEDYRKICEETRLI